MLKLASPIRGDLIRTGKYGKRGQVDVGGLKSGVNHEGLDVRAPVGTPVYPTIGGTVVQTITGWTSEASVGVSRGRRIFTPGMTGNTVVIRGDDGRDHVYAHNSSVSTVVGRRVETSTMIARSGKSGGNRMAAHLHYGIWLEYAPNKWRSIDPTPLLPLAGDKFGQLDIKAINALEEDDMNAEDRLWLQGTLNEAEKRIKADTGVKIEAAMSAIGAVGEALGKIGAGGLAGSDRVWMQSVLNSAEKRIKEADQAVVIDAGTLREALEGAGLAADVADELAKRLTA